MKPVALTLFVALLLAACGTQPSPQVTEMPAPSAAASPDGVGAIGLLQCDAVPSEVGGAGEGISEGQGGADPDEALAVFLDTTAFVIPRSGYEPIGQAGDRHAYGYRVDGLVKVVVVVSTRFEDLVGARFSADEVRTCPSPEFGSDATFADGRRVWTHVDSGLILTDIVGPGHCEWQAARLMHVLHADGSLDRQYVRDPLGVLARSPMLESYAEGVELPGDATDSGYRSPEGYELWFTDADTAAYVVTPDGIERWPRTVEAIACR